ncbi:hypothetical protein M2475_001850 [Breznakia sp. PF5-3]|uniref:hypothetical protein n=1 Tax=unclassified Breznakia TaxID=2623764 RepID=UPI002405DFD2|nr:MULTISPECIES: hypothetical protein [unclassified Breznakia]MDF9825395.1 hypothetical protein [Breznakia sp. PM6-1]MDF9836273.1 hypothetical protein [Breznakia sp. PF5-3]MDF9837575.1 hypothetical protein [Breznakia sp. PFB2-8]MDF9860188.1 hypothetical protein [Breznakia sp. PH5-24]
MKRLFSFVLVLGLILTGCGSSDDDNDIKDDKEKETFEAMSDDDINSELSDISNWVVGDYWNDGLVDIRDYLHNGTDATGKEMDITITLKRYNKAYKKAAKYDKFIKSLDEDKYGDIKEAWNTMYEEMKIKDEYIQSNDIVAKGDPEFSTDLFAQYRDYFTDLVYDLE